MSGQYVRYGQMRGVWGFAHPWPGRRGVGGGSGVLPTPGQVGGGGGWGCTHPWPYTGVSVDL